MIDFELQEVQCEPELLHVLDAYHRQQLMCADSTAEGEEEVEWFPRIDSIDQVPSEQLPRLHGKLIALGLLKFQLAGRTSGVHYQMSRTGKQVLARLADTSSQPSDEPVSEISA